jgi:hypothetical protein
MAAEYVTLKKLKSAIDVKDWIREYLDIKPDEKLTGEQMMDVIEDFGYDSISELKGTWINTEKGVAACGMPNKPDGMNFVRDVSPVMVIVHGRKYIEEVPVYEWKHSGLGLISKDVWEGLW